MDKYTVGLPLELRRENAFEEELGLRVATSLHLQSSSCTGNVYAHPIVRTSAEPLRFPEFPFRFCQCAQRGDARTLLAAYLTLPSFSGFYRGKRQSQGAATLPHFSKCRE